MEKTPINFVKNTIRGSLWSYASRYSGKLMIFVSTVILARLLTQDDFGVAGYALVTMSFLEILNGFGVLAAVIYFPDDKKIANVAFWIAQGMGLILMLLTLAIAPLAGEFFNDPRAIPVVRALAFNFPISALRIVHDALLQKELSFSRRFIPDLILSTSKGVISILLAALGMGVWSLIIGHILGNALSVFTYWIVMPWRPSLKIDTRFIKPLLSFGKNIIALEFLAIVLTESDYLIVGHYMGAAALGVYTMAFRIPDMLIVQFNYTISKVIFPAFTKVRDDLVMLEKTYLNTLRYVTLITIPLGIGTALVARPLVIVFLSEKWIDAYPVLQAISVYAMMLSLSHHTGDVYKAQGRPQIDVYISAVKAVFLIPGLIWAASVEKSIVAVGWVHVTVATAGAISSLFIASRVMKIAFKDILNSISPAILGGGSMACVVSLVMILLATSTPVIQLSAGVLAGILTYCFILFWFQRDVVFSIGKLLQTAFGGVKQ